MLIAVHLRCCIFIFPSSFLSLHTLSHTITPPLMARAQRQKLARESTAAYSASQPLFDALRSGANQIGEQKFLLTQARDLVQTVHVKLVNTQGNADAEKQDQYVDHIVKAWRSATEVYSAVFEELASITAADATEGRAASKGHEEFTAMSASVEAAKKVAMSYKLAESQPTTKSRKATAESVGSGEEVGQSTSEKGKSARATPSNSHLLPLHGKRKLPSEDSKSDVQPPAKMQKLSEGIRVDSSGKKVFWERGASKPNVPFATLDASEKKAWRAEKARQKREKKKAKSMAKSSATISTETGAGTDGRPLRLGGRAKDYEDNITAEEPAFAQDYVPLDAETRPAGKENTVPGIEYEDVSAEVEARLKAKEERKKAKKDEKKRKRESGASVVDAAPTETALQKPKLKKVKAETADDGQAGSAIADQVEKRKTEEVADHHDVGKGRKKRRKSKG